MRTLRIDLILLVGLAMSGVPPALAASQEPLSARDQARQILDASGIKGGLIVHLGCGDGALTAALHANDSFLVHGLLLSDGRLIVALNPGTRPDPPPPGKQVCALDAIPSPPVWDGMAAAGGCRYLRLMDGKVLCLAASR